MSKYVLCAIVVLVATAGALPGQTVATIPFNIQDRGGISQTTVDAGPVITTGYGRIRTEPGASAPAGVAILALRQNGILVSEAGVPATKLVTAGRLYAEIDGSVDTGIAIANPSGADATISFTFTDTTGRDFGSGTTTIPAGGQIARFLSQAPFNGTAPLRGAFTFNSSVPVAVIALRGFTNQRGEFLITTLPIAGTEASSREPANLPYFADGGGWTTQILLVNSTEETLTGDVEFLDPGGATSSRFPFSIPRRSSHTLTTAGSGLAVQTGSVRVAPAGNSAAPVSLSIFSFTTPGGVTVSAAGVAAQQGSVFRTYVEASATFGKSGSKASGIAIANPSTAPAAVALELSRPDGTATGLATSLMIPGSGQVAKFINELFPTLTGHFEGILRVSTLSASGISMAALRSRYNERGDFLITTTPPMSEAVAGTSDELFLPHIAVGGGYSMQLILHSASQGQSSSGTVQFVSQSGEILPLTLRPFDQAPSNLAFLGELPTAVEAGVTISPPIRVAVQDALGKTITSSSLAVTLSLATSPAGGRLLGTTTVNAVNGVATFTNVMIDRGGNGYSLVAYPRGIYIDFSGVRPGSTVNNLALNGVRFGFHIAGVESTDANIGVSGPGSTRFIEDPNLEGNAAGILTLDFAVPTPHLSFGTALASNLPLRPGFTVQLFDRNLNSMGIFPINAAPYQIYAESMVDNLGLPGGASLGPIKRAVLDFREDEFPRFAFDNLSFADAAVAGINGAVSSQINVTVKPPTITSIVPATVRRGSSSALQINGTNLLGGSVQFRINGQISDNLALFAAIGTGSQLNGTVAVFPTALVGNYSVTVSTAGGTSNPLELTVISTDFTGVSTNGTSPGFPGVEVVRNTTVTLTITGTHLEGATQVLLVLNPNIGRAILAAGTPSVSADGNVATVTYRVPPDAPVGRYSLVMAFSNTTITSNLYVDVIA